MKGLRAKCENYGIDSHGSKEVLLARIEGYELGLNQRKRPLDNASAELLQLLKSKPAGSELVSQVQALLDDGANPNTSNEKGKTPIFYVCKITGPISIDIASMLKRYGALLNVTTSGVTLLHYALTKCNWSLARWFVKEGIDIFTTNSSGESILFTLLIYCADECSDQAYALFLELFPKFDVLSANNFECTLLHYACEAADIRYATLLLKTKLFVVDCECFQGLTALMYAAKNHRIGAELIHLLLDHGADQMRVDKSGKSAFVYAYECANIEAMKAFESTYGSRIILHGRRLPYHGDGGSILKVLRYGRASGVSINEVENELMSMIKRGYFSQQQIWACARFVMPMSKDLRQAILDSNNTFVWRMLAPLAVTQQDQAGYTALHHAILKRNIDILELALRQGINPFIRSALTDSTAADLIQTLEIKDRALKSRMLARLDEYSTFCFTRQHAQWYGVPFVTRAYTFLLVVQRWRKEGERSISKDIILCILRWLGLMEEK